MTSPILKAIVFVDGQNLYRCAQRAFDLSHPNYDIDKLAKLVTGSYGMQLTRTHFYTGVPEKKDDAKWNDFWGKKWLSMSRQGIKLFKRPIRYREETFVCPEDHEFTKKVGYEKGIDVRIAIDIIKAALSGECDAIVIFSQDQDLSEAVKEVKDIAKNQNRFIRIICAFPVSEAATNKQGIHDTEWFRISEHEYRNCIDPADYRPKQRKLPFR